MICDLCSCECGRWKFRYRGEIYCRKCFHEHFELLECTRCRRRKYIHYKTKPTPVCKRCAAKDQPCIRCKRDVEKLGRITKYGVVCASCARYFLTPKKCSKCGVFAKNVFNRTASGDAVPLCDACYRKTLPICTKCRRHQKAHIFDATGKPVCARCAEGDATCRQCGKPFPRGRGKICKECSSTNGLRDKTAFAKSALSEHIGTLFEAFSRYLLHKRGTAFASHRILYFFPFFQEIDRYMLDKKGTFPTFEEFLNHFSVAHTKKYLTAMRFFESERLIVRDRKIQALFSELDMIERYLRTFEENSRFYHVVQHYYRHLYDKQLCGDIGVRTLRLSLATAIKYLRYRSLFDEGATEQRILDGYLWCFPGQRNSLSGFIRFYNKNHGMSLKVYDKHKTSAPFLKSPSDSKRRREQRFIQMLRTLSEESSRKNRYDKESVLRISIEYLHDVAVPKYGVKLSFLPIKRIDKQHHIRFAGRNFYLPEEVVRYLR